MGKKYYKKKGNKKPYKNRKNYNYNNRKIKDSDIGAVIGVIVTIVVAFILKILFWIFIIGILLFSIYLFYKVFTSRLGDKLKSLLIILILLFNLIGGIIVFEKQNIVYQKIDNIASDIGGYFGYKKGKIIIDNEAGIENIIQNEAINNLNNNK